MINLINLINVINSLTHWSSLANSILSRLSSRNSRATTAELTKEEMKIWNELVDDSKMDIPRPLYTTISTLNRKCCMPPLLGMSFDTVSGMCETCGFSVQHRRAMSLLNTSEIHLSPVTDFYGNTLLHCAAAAFIEPGLWKQHFNTQDNAGNKVLDVWEDSCSRIGKKSLAEGMAKLMATIMKDITPPPTVVQYQSDLAGRATIPGQITNEDVYGWLGDLILVPGMTEKEATERPLEDIRLERRLTWIDDSGDTPLTALLKSPLAATIPADSLRKYVKCMLKFGAEIHIRDRKGDTALAIAARLGIHSVVTLLLEEGANVHSRDYLGAGILSQTERSLDRATGDGKLWAMIWSCRITLIDAGAKEEPTDQDEWMLPLSTRLKSQEIGHWSR
ncbi:hypothetical protein F5882DRAFT_438323 [Hyaloscypha sp. PMI_1271]|nr:hypothetical protein F5882DRAFT_438323 [Hyaloscypha sp. PMI_1271]